MTVGYLSYSNLSVQHIIHNRGGRRMTDEETDELEEREG